MKLYLYEYYRGFWQRIVSDNPNLIFAEVEQVLCRKVTLPETLNSEIVVWISNLQLKDFDDYLKESDIPKGVKVAKKKELEVV